MNCHNHKLKSHKIESVWKVQIMQKFTKMTWLLGWFVQQFIARQPGKHIFKIPPKKCDMNSPLIHYRCIKSQKCRGSTSSDCLVLQSGWEGHNLPHIMLVLDQWYLFLDLQTVTLSLDEWFLPKIWYLLQKSHEEKISLKNVAMWFTFKKIGAKSIFRHYF